MKRILLVVGLFALTGCINVQGTGNPNDIPTDQTSPEPPPTGYNFQLDGVNFTEHNGEIVMVRVILGPNVIACKDDVVVQNDSFSVTFDGVLQEGESYVVEFVANTDGNVEYNSGTDRVFMVEVADVAGDEVRSYDATGGEHGIGWPIKTACP